MDAICVVDDSPVVTAQVKRLLAAVGLDDVVVFNDAGRALQWCLSSEPSIILLDYNMPQMDGLEFLRRLKLHSRAARALVAMMTGWETASLRKRALDEGAVALIAKPFGGREFQDFVGALKGRAKAPMVVREDESAPEPDGQWPMRDERNTFEVSRLLHEFALVRPPLICANHALLRSLMLATARAHGLDGLAVGQLDAALRRILRLSQRLGAPLGLPETDEQACAESDRRLAEIARAILELLKTRAPDALKMSAQMVVSAQEWWDGTGWPLGARGVAIPLPARLFSVVHHFAVLASPTLSAGDPVPFDLLLTMMDASVGKEFDPAMVRALRGAAPAVLNAAETGLVVPIPSRRT